MDKGKIANIMCQDRAQKIRAEIKKERLDGFLVSSASNITYLTGYSNFSKEEREAYLLLTKNRTFLFTDGRYKEAIRKHIPFVELVEIGNSSPFTSQLKKAVNSISIKNLGFEKENITYQEFELLKRTMLKKASLKPILNLIKRLRAIKNQEEIKSIKKACKLTDKTFTFILNRIKEGVTEREISFEIEFFIKTNGGDIAFPPIVAFGENSSIPHHQTSEKQLATSDKQLLLDFGARVNNYCSDMTRVVFLGKAGAQAKKMYSTVVSAQQKAIDFLTKVPPLQRWHLNTEGIDKIARDHIISKGFPSIPHGLGHGVGLEVHEFPKLSPKSKDMLEPNMVFTIEPGIYLPGFGGVRIEDTILLTDRGPQILTKSPKEITEIQLKS